MNKLKNKEILYIFITSLISGFLLYKIMQEHVAFYGYELFSNLSYDIDSNSNGKHSFWFIVFMIAYTCYISSLIFILINLKRTIFFIISSLIIFSVLWIDFDVKEYRKEGLLNKYNTFLSLNSGFDKTENSKLLVNYINEVNIIKFTEIYSKRLENIKASEESVSNNLMKIKNINSEKLLIKYNKFNEDNYISIKENEDLKKHIQLEIISNKLKDLKSSVQ